VISSATPQTTFRIDTPGLSRSIAPASEFLGGFMMTERSLFRKSRSTLRLCDTRFRTGQDCFGLMSVVRCSRMVRVSCRRCASPVTGQQRDITAQYQTVSADVLRYKMIQDNFSYRTLNIPRFAIAMTIVIVPNSPTICAAEVDNKIKLACP
jgi:hypothetical protein